METSTLKEILMTKLDCGYADLEMLDDLYTDLAEDCVDVDEIIQENQTLNDILYYLYEGISQRVAEELYKLAELEEIEIEVKNSGNFDVLSVTAELKDFIIDLAEELSSNTTPYCNYLDTHFQNVLDNTVYWSVGARRNAEIVIEQELKHLTDEEFKKLVHLVDEEE